MVAELLQQVRHSVRRLTGRERGPGRERLLAAGVKLGEKVTLERGVEVDLPWGWLITIDDWAGIGPGVRILAHDASTRRALGYTRIAPVHIGARVFIGADAIVLPGVTIGDDAIIGAGSVVSRDVPAGALAAGVPARVLMPAADYLAARQARIDDGLRLDDLRDERVSPGWPTARVDVARRIADHGEAWVR